MSTASEPGSDAEHHSEEVRQDVNGLTVHGLADAPDVYIGYLPSFRAHLRDTRAHLTGSIPFHDDTRLVPPIESTPAPHTHQDNALSPPEQIEGDPEPPRRESKPTIWSSSLSSWSQSEVDAFFHAVSIYSRWRPDLIADAVKTKGEVEVVEFIITLDSCARSRATETDQDILSDEWVAAEEAMAAALVVEEDHGELEELEASRRKRVRDARADMIPRGKRRRVTAGVGEDELMADEDFEGESVSVEVVAGEARFEKWHAREIAAWEQDDLLKKLEDMHLQKEKSLSREGSADVISQESDTGMDLKALSPTSRRRLTKRLYMRRKRAQLRGEDVAPTSLARIKPGRKRKEKAATVAEEIGKEMLPSGENDRGRRVAATPDPTEPDPEVNDDDLRDAGEEATKKCINMAGKTRYQKIRSEFKNAGINASYLSKHGMDLFHLGRLGKARGVCLDRESQIYKSLEQCPEDDVSATYVSPELIQYLQASVVAFTTDVIHRATMWKEQANELKGQKKVWKGALHQINQPAVEYALKIIGMRTLSRQEHFSKLLDDLSPNKRKRKQKSTPSANAKDERASAAGHSPDAPSYEIGLSPHRAIYTPALLAPASFNIGIVDTFFPGYDGCFPSKARSNKDSHEIEDSLLPDETDEKALEDELREDEMLDQADVEAGKRVEAQLWAEVEREEGYVASER
ncbi:hypothetical protein DFH29DRAFT_933903 [Suillus ampliporus]|nr:hypothetical protein DFH29DRAFT_933903 [Suillus ampliporus]